MVCFKLGDVVRATADIDYLPHAYIKEGEVGRFITYEKGADGGLAIVVRWERVFPGLARWSNTTLLEPPEDTVTLTSSAVPGSRGIYEPAANEGGLPC